MNSLALSFHNVNFNPVIQSDGQIWLSGSELAQALDYKSIKSISNLYNSNKDEFTEKMTQVIDIVEVTDSMTPTKQSNLKKKLRIFSLRGCHLIAMFARTTVAKEFRKWVLDVLDKHIGVPVCKTHKSDRLPLHDAHALLVAKTKHLNSSDAWKLINQRFGTQSIDEIPFDSIPVAVEYVHHLIALYSNADRQQFSHADLQNVHALATHMIWVREWWRTFGDSIRVISPTMAAAVHDHFKDGASIAWGFVDQRKKDDLKHAVQDYEWLLPYNQRRQYLAR